MAPRFTLALLVFLVAAVIPAGAQTFVFDLRGSQEVPPVPSTASGGCFGQLDQLAATFSLTCAHDVIGATVMHLHQGAPGTNGAVVFDLGDPASPVSATWTSMTPANITDLLAGNLYVNIHTAGRPAGEIRGQIVNSVDAVAFTANGAQVVPPNGSPATANCTADLNAGATSLAVACTHDLAGADSAHVHDAPFGVNGPVVFTFPSAASPLSGSVPMTPLLAAKYAATFLYLEVHTPGGTEESPSETIRGQIGTPPAGAGTGTIIIVKESYPAGGTGFQFTDNIAAPNAFTLDDGGTQTFSSVSPGTYSVTESDPSSGGFTLGDLSCDDADSTGDPFSRTATLNLAAGEVITCRFRNLETAPTDSIFVFHLSGDQEVPAVAAPDRGGCMGRFDSGASELTLVCTHDLDFPTIMHVHQGAPGVNGPIVFDLGDPTSPVIATWSGMTPANVADLLAGNFYVNVHTSGRPGGAIRGQVLTRTVDTVAFTADAAQVVPPGSSAATANCTADLSNDATGLAVSCTHDLPAPDQAHVHRAPRGENGPLVHTFASPASPIAGNVPMTPRLVADFAATFLYVDIHGPVVGEGGGTSDAIRGQIATPLAVPTTGTIRIVKSTSPAGGSGFTFTDDVPGSTGSFTLADGGVQTFSSVVEGTYTITENASGTHSLTGITCDDGDSTGNAYARVATVRLQPGEIVTCTFANLQNVVSPTLFVFHLSAGQEVPPTDSTARGGCFAQLDSVTRRLAIVCTHDVSSPAIAHIHRGPAGTNGPALFDLGNPLSPISGTWMMTPADVTDLLAGNLYVNIHASGRPDGEIRGQMLPRTVDSFAFPATGAQEVPPNDSAATGDCLADLATAATSVRIDCTHEVTTPSSIHLHAAPPGVDGPVIFTFPNGPSFGDDVPLTPRLVADFAAGFLYVNIHSTPDFPDGEIRGQLIAGAPASHVAAIPTLGEWAALLMILSLVALAWWRIR